MSDDARDPRPSGSPGPQDEGTWFRIVSILLEERTLRWLLGLGILLLLAGIASLIIKHWDIFAQHTILQYLLLLVFTGSMLGVGEVLLGRLGLPRTAFAFHILCLAMVPLDFVALGHPELHIMEGPVGVAAYFLSLPLLAWAAHRSIEGLFGWRPPGGPGSGPAARPVRTPWFALSLVLASGAIPLAEAWRVDASLVHFLPVYGTAFVLVFRGLACAHERFLLGREAPWSAPFLLGISLYTLAAVTLSFGLKTGFIGLTLVSYAILASNSCWCLVQVRSVTLGRDTTMSIGFAGLMASILGLSLAYWGTWDRNGTLAAALLLATGLYAGLWVVYRRPFFLYLMIGGVSLTILLAGYLDPDVHRFLSGVVALLLGPGTPYAVVPLAVVAVLLERLLWTRIAAPVRLRSVGEVASPHEARRVLGGSALALSLATIGLAWSDARGGATVLGLWAFLYALAALAHQEKDLLLAAGLCAGAAVLPPAFSQGSSPAAVAMVLSLIPPGLLGLGLALGPRVVSRMSSFTGWDRKVAVHPLTAAALIVLVAAGLATAVALHELALWTALALVVQGLTLLALWHRYRREFLGLWALAAHTLAAGSIVAAVGFPAGPQPEPHGLVIALVMAVGLGLVWFRRLLESEPGGLVDPISLSGQIHVVAVLLLCWIDRQTSPLVAPVILISSIAEIAVAIGRPAGCARPLLHLALASLVTTIWIDVGRQVDRDIALVALQGLQLVLVGTALAASSWVRSRLRPWPGNGVGELSNPFLEAGVLLLPVLWMREGPASGLHQAFALAATVLACAWEYRLPWLADGAAVIGLCGLALDASSPATGWTAVPLRVAICAAFFAFAWLSALDPGRRGGAPARAAWVGHGCCALLAASAWNAGVDGTVQAVILTAFYLLAFRATSGAGSMDEPAAYLAHAQRAGFLAAGIQSALLAVVLALTSTGDLRFLVDAGLVALLAWLAPVLSRTLALAGPDVLGGFVPLADLALVDSLALALLGPTRSPVEPPLAVLFFVLAVAHLGILRARRHWILAWSTVVLAGAGAAVMALWAPSPDQIRAMRLAGAAVLTATLALAVRRPDDERGEAPPTPACPGSPKGAPAGAGSPFCLLETPLTTASVVTAGLAVVCLSLAVPKLVQSRTDFLGIPALFSGPMAVALSLVALACLEWEALGSSGPAWLVPLCLAPVGHGLLATRVPPDLQPPVLVAAGALSWGLGRLIPAGRDRGLVGFVSPLAPVLWATGHLLRLSLAAAFTALVVTGPMPVPPTLAVALAALALFDALCCATRRELSGRSAWANDPVTTTGPVATLSLALLAFSAVCWLGPARWCDRFLWLGAAGLVVGLMARTRPDPEGPAWLQGVAGPRRSAGLLTALCVAVVVSLVVGPQPSWDAAGRLALAAALLLAVAWVIAPLPTTGPGLAMLGLAGVEACAAALGGREALIGAAVTPFALLAAHAVLELASRAIERWPFLHPAGAAPFLLSSRLLAGVGTAAVVLAAVPWVGWPADPRAPGFLLALALVDAIFLRARRASGVACGWFSQSVGLSLVALAVVQADSLVLGTSGPDLSRPHFWPLLSATLAFAGVCHQGLAAVIRAHLRVPRGTLPWIPVDAALLDGWGRAHGLAATLCLFPAVAGIMWPGFSHTVDLAASTVLLLVLSWRLPFAWPRAAVGLTIALPLHAGLSALAASGALPSERELILLAPALGAYFLVVAGFLPRACGHPAVAWVFSSRGDAGFGVALARAARDGAAVVSMVPVVLAGDPSALLAASLAASSMVLALASHTTRRLRTGAAGMVLAGLAVHVAVWTACARSDHIELVGLTFALANLVLALLYGRLAAAFAGDDPLGTAPAPEVADPGRLFAPLNRAFLFWSGSRIHPWLAWGAALVDAGLSLTTLGAALATVRLAGNTAVLVLLRRLLGSRIVDAPLTLVLAALAVQLDASGLDRSCRDFLGDPLDPAAVRLLTLHLAGLAFVLSVITWALGRSLAGSVFPVAARSTGRAALALSAPLALLSLDGTTAGACLMGVSLLPGLFVLSTVMPGAAVERRWARRALLIQLSLFGIQVAIGLAGGRWLEHLFQRPGLATVGVLLSILFELLARHAAAVPEAETEEGVRLVDSAAARFTAVLWSWVTVITSFAPLVLAFPRLLAVIDELSFDPGWASVRHLASPLPVPAVLAWMGLVQLAVLPRLRSTAAEAPGADVSRPPWSGWVLLQWTAAIFELCALAGLVRVCTGTASVIEMVSWPSGLPLLSFALLVGAATARRGAVSVPERLSPWFDPDELALIGRVAGELSAATALLSLAWAAAAPGAVTGWFAVAAALSLSLVRLELSVLAPASALLLAAAAFHACVRWIVLALAVPGDPVRVYLLWPVAAIEAFVFVDLLGWAAPWLCRRAAFPRSVLEAAAWLGDGLVVALGLASLGLAFWPGLCAPEPGPVAVVALLFLACRLARPSEEPRPWFDLSMLGLAVQIGRCVAGTVTPDGGHPWQLLAALLPGWAAGYAFLALTPAGVAALLVAWVGAAATLRLTGARRSARPLLSRLVRSALLPLVVLGSTDGLWRQPPAGTVFPAPGGWLTHLALGLAALLSLRGRPADDPARPAIGALSLSLLVFAAEAVAWRAIAGSLADSGDRVFAMALAQLVLGVGLTVLSRWAHGHPGPGGGDIPGSRSGPAAAIAALYPRSVLSAWTSVLGHGAGAGGLLLLSWIGPSPATDLLVRGSQAALLLVSAGVASASPAWGIIGLGCAVVSCHALLWLVATPRLSQAELFAWPVWAALEWLLMCVMRVLAGRLGRTVGAALPDGALRAAGSLFEGASLILGLAGTLHALCAGTQDAARLAVWMSAAFVAHSVVLGQARDSETLEGYRVFAIGTLAWCSNLVWITTPWAGGLGAACLDVLGLCLAQAVLWWALSRPSVLPNRARARARASALFSMVAVVSGLVLTSSDAADAGSFAVRALMAGATMAIHLVLTPRDRLDRLLWEHLSLAVLLLALARAFEAACPPGVSRLVTNAALVSVAAWLWRWLGSAMSRGRLAPLGRIWESSTLARSALWASRLATGLAICAFCDFDPRSPMMSLSLATAAAVVVIEAVAYPGSIRTWIALLAGQAAVLHLLWGATLKPGAPGWPTIVLHPVTAYGVLAGLLVVRLLGASRAGTGGVAPEETESVTLAPPGAAPCFRWALAVAVGLGVIGRLALDGFELRGPIHLAMLALPVLLVGSGLAEPSGSARSARSGWLAAFVGLTLALAHDLLVHAFTLEKLLEGLDRPGLAAFEVSLVAVLWRVERMARDSGAVWRPVVTGWKQVWSFVAGLASLFPAAAYGFGWRHSADLAVGWTDAVPAAGFLIVLRWMSPTLLQDAQVVIGVLVVGWGVASRGDTLPAAWARDPFLTPGAAFAAVQIALLLLAVERLAVLMGRSGSEGAAVQGAGSASEAPAGVEWASLAYRAGRMVVWLAIPLVSVGPALRAAGGHAAATDLLVLYALQLPALAAFRSTAWTSGLRPVAQCWSLLLVGGWICLAGLDLPWHPSFDLLAASAALGFLALAVAVEALGRVPSPGFLLDVSGAEPRTLMDHCYDRDVIQSVTRLLLALALPASVATLAAVAGARPEGALSLALAAGVQTVVAAWTDWRLAGWLLSLTAAAIPVWATLVLAGGCLPALAWPLLPLALLVWAELALVAQPLQGAPTSLGAVLPRVCVFCRLAGTVLGLGPAVALLSGADRPLARLVALALVEAALATRSGAVRSGTPSTRSIVVLVQGRAAAFGAIVGFTLALHQGYLDLFHHGRLGEVPHQAFLWPLLSALQVTIALVLGWIHDPGVFCRGRAAAGPAADERSEEPVTPGRPARPEGEPWRPVAGWLAQPLALLALLSGAGTLVVNLAAGGDPLVGVRIASLAALVQLVGVFVIETDPSPVSIGLVSLGWFLWAGNRLQDLSAGAVVSLVQIAFALAGAFWLAVAALGRRHPCGGFVPTSSTCELAATLCAVVAAVAGVPVALLMVPTAVPISFPADPWPPVRGLVAVLVTLLTIHRWPPPPETDGTGSASPATALPALLLGQVVVLYAAVAARLPWIHRPDSPGDEALVIAILALVLGGLLELSRRTPLAPIVGNDRIDAVIAASGVASQVAVLAAAFTVASLELSATVRAVLAVAVMFFASSGPGGVIGRWTWPPLAVFAVSQAAAALVALVLGEAGILEGLMLTPTLAAVLVAAHRAAHHLVQALERPEDGAWSAHLRARIDADAFAFHGALFARLAWPLALVSLLSAGECGWATVGRLAASVALQLCMFTQRRTDARRVALAGSLSLATIHLVLAATGPAGPFAAGVLPRLGFAAILAGVLLEAVRHRISSLAGENELSNVVGVFAQAAALVSLPIVFAAVWLLDLTRPPLPLATVILNVSSLALLSGFYFYKGYQLASETCVYMGEVALASLYGYLRVTGIAHRTEYSGLVGVMVNFGLYALARWADERKLETFARPLKNSSLVLPLVLILFEVRHLDAGRVWGNVLMLASIGAFYTTAAMDAGWRNLQYLAALFYNLALFRVWSMVGRDDPVGYLACLSITTGWIVEINRDVFSRRLRGNLRLLSAILMMGGPVVSYFAGTAQPRFLALGCLAVVVATVGVLSRIRLFFYSGTLVLLLDVATFLASQTAANWGVFTAALVLGGVSAIGVAAVFERQRERIIDRLRRLQADLEQWD